MTDQRGDTAALHAFLARAWRLRTRGPMLDGAAVGALLAIVAILSARRLESLRVDVVVTMILIAAGAAIQLTRAYRARPRIALEVERRAPQFQNLLVTSAELMAATTAARPDVAALVWQRASGTAAAVDPRALFPAGWAMLRAIAAAGLWAIVLVLSRPSIVDVKTLAPVHGTAAVQRIDVAVTPPAYTHLPPVALHDPAEVRVVTGSRLHVTVRAIADRVTMDMLETRLEFTRESDEAFSADVLVDREGYMAIEPASAAGRGLRRLVGLTVDPDRPPLVQVTQPGHDLFLSDVASRRLPIDVSAADDLGLTSLRVKYTKVSGGGEDFTFKEGELAVRVTPQDARHWTASTVLDLGGLGLEVGDMVVYRALAADARPGAAAAESDAFVVQVVNPDQAAAGGFAADDDPNRFAVSERMIILKTEQLVARRTTMSAEAFTDQAQSIAAEQRHVRAEFIFMMGGEMEDLAAVADSLDETAEAAREDELAAGRLQNRGAVDLIFATRHMSHAVDALTRPDAPAALTSEKAALAALQRAFTKSRYLLRSLSTQERLDMTRRLSGTLTGLAPDTRPPAAAEPLQRITALCHALAGVASLSATNMANLARSARATALAEDVLRVDPADAALRAIATDLTRAAAEIAAGRGSTAATLVDQAAADLASVIRSGTEDAPRPETGPARRFGGAVADAQKAQVKR